MKKLLLFLLLPVLSFGQVQIGEDIDGEAAGDGSGFALSLSEDGGILAVGAPFNSGNGSNSGHVRVYENVSGDWMQLGNDINGLNSNDAFGFNISISAEGNIIAIAAPFNDDNLAGSGQVKVFEYIGGSWVQIGESINGENLNGNSGFSIDLSSDGNRLVVGEPYSMDTGDAFGVVRIYENQNENWVQIGQQILGENEFDSSGESVGISGDGNSIIIGSPTNSSSANVAGQIRVYENQGGNWIQVGNDINGESSDDEFGSKVDISFDGSIVVGSSRFNNGNGSNSGHVRLYENQGGSWVQIGDDINGESSGDQFGSTLKLSLNGNIVSVGASFNDGNGTNSGHSRIFQRQSDSWVQVGNNINGEFSGDGAGFVTISADGDTVALGGPGNDDNGTDSGNVRVFDISDEILSTQETSITTFSLYPNPTKNNLTINLLNSDTLQKATIYNSLGQEVLQLTQTNIDVSSLSKGMFVVEVQTSTGKGSEKLIIN